MKIFIALFKKEDLNRKIIKLFGNQLKEFKNVFPNYSEESKNIDKGIVYFKGKANNPLNCYIVDIRKIDLNEDQIIIEFDPTIELDEDSEKINKRLYRFAIEREWVNKKTGFFPIICITDDNSFDNIRKGTSSRTKSYNNLSRVEENKKNSDWISTCNMYEPLEELSKNIEV
ncbi:MAG: hypothetical protein SA378_05440 [Sedimentibacter sp.]|uniref:hypothetical protein n=1 Tax=Sedimentibacter sp. TaxID=1960295 RepID=UPI002981B16E|nr:hypothetical protein [Sedimentibacter sp.]MDW5299565.1 hypothetical protein [Sedimentibacter sp.]